MTGLRWAGFITGIIVALLFATAAIVPPEEAPRWWQEYFFSTPNVLTGGGSAEKATPAAQSRIYVGRQDAGEAEATLQFNELPSRQETAWADGRVDARGQYRSTMAGLAMYGAVLAILCCCLGRGCGCKEKKAVGKTPTRDGEFKPRALADQPVKAGIQRNVTPSDDRSTVRGQEERPAVRTQDVPAPQSDRCWLTIRVKNAVHGDVVTEHVAEVCGMPPERIGSIDANLDIGEGVTGFRFKVNQ